MAEKISLEDFNIKICVQWIEENNLKKVGLLIPEIYLAFAVDIVNEIASNAGCETIILADFKKRGCCANEQSARQYFDGIIHFGSTCLTPPTSVKILYTLSPCLPFNVQEVISSLRDNGASNDEKLVVTYNTLLKLQDDDIRMLTKEYPNLLVSRLDPGEGVNIIHGEKIVKASLSSQNTNTCRFHSRAVDLPNGDEIKAYNIIHIGPHDPTLQVLQYKFPEAQFYHFDTTSKTLSTYYGFKSIIKRSAKLEQLKSAEFIGILIGSIAVRGHVEIRHKLEDLIESCGKRCRSYVVSRINEAKLANFTQPDVIIYVDCPENSIFDRNEDPYLYKRLVTPWEAEAALNPGVQWTFSFELNFREFIPGGRLYQEPPVIEEIEKDTDKASEDRLCVRLPGIVSTTGGWSLADASWKGLDPSSEAPYAIGQIVEGRKGIASAYEGEIK